MNILALVDSFFEDFIVFQPECCKSITYGIFWGTQESRVGREEVLQTGRLCFKKSFALVLGYKKGRLENQKNDHTMPASQRSMDIKSSDAILENKMVSPKRENPLFLEMSI